MPTFPARLSQKCSPKLSGSFSIGTESVGFLAFAPCLANSENCLCYSGSTFNATTITMTPATPYTGTTVSTFPTMPYAAGGFIDGTGSAGSSMAGRFVSVAIRVRYTGTELNRGGTLYAMVRPDHENMNGQSISSISSYKEAIKVPVSRTWTEIVASAVDPDETTFFDATRYLNTGGSGVGTEEYVLSMYPFSQGQHCDSGSPTVGAPIIAFMATGVTGNTFEFEIIQHVEYIGRDTQAMATKSHSDQDGLSKVTNVAGNVQALRNSTNLSQAAAFATGMYDMYRENKALAHAGVGILANLFSSGSGPSLRGMRQLEF